MWQNPQIANAIGGPASKIELLLTSTYLRIMSAAAYLHVKSGVSLFCALANYTLRQDTQKLLPLRLPFLP